MLVGSVVFAVGAAWAAQLNLDWMDNSGGTATFNIERKTGTDGTYAWIATTGTGATSYSDPTVAPGTTYCYRVKASSSFGDSDYSNEACGIPADGLDVTVLTTGSGTVVSAPAGIMCPGTCTQSYTAGTVLSLIAIPATGSSFSGWSGGGCTGIFPCILTGNTPATVTASFASTDTQSSATSSTQANSTPGLAGLSPAAVAASGSDFTLTVTGNNFTPNSGIQINGGLRTTTFVSETQLAAAIPASDIARAGTLTVTVFTPAPGGGASNGLSLVVEALTGPSVAVDTTGTPASGTVTATLTNGLGGDTDWLALAQVGAPDTSYLQWTYVGGGVTTRTWAINMPADPGQYEFRLFPNNGYVRAATSPAVTVRLGNAISSTGPSIAIDSALATPGSAVTATLINGFGGSTDWLALAAVGSPNAGYLQWIYVGPGVTTRTWTINMPDTPGQYEFRFFPNNSYILTATSPVITVGN